MTSNLSTWVNQLSFQPIDFFLPLFAMFSLFRFLVYSHAYCVVSTYLDVSCAQVMLVSDECQISVLRFLKSNKGFAISSSLGI